MITRWTTTPIEIKNKIKYDFRGYLQWQIGQA